MTVRRVSIKDVAREAGVSVTTVSHALNGKGRLSDETRARVTAVADRMQYRPNPAARSLVSGRTRLIAAMASLPDDPRIEVGEFAYHSALVGAASGAALARDHALVVAPPSRSGFIWERVSLDGVIVIDPMIGEPALPALRARGIPFVTVGLDPDGGAGASVSSDEVSGTYAVLDHLAARGGERVALLAMPPVNAFARDTAACYPRWCVREGRDGLVVTFGLEDLLARQEEALFDAVRSLLERGADAIYAPLELIGVDVLRIVQSLGCRVPEDVMLVTTMDSGKAMDTSPAITTLSFDYDRLGRRAAEILLDLIAGEGGPVQETVACFVEERASTARSVPT